MARGATVSLQLLMFLGSGGAALAGGASAPPAAALSPRADTALAALLADSELASENVVVSLHPATGTLRFLRPRSSGAALIDDSSTAPTATATARATVLLARYPDLLGVPAAALTAVGEERDGLGQTHVRFVQHHGEVPVFAAELRVHLDAAGRVVALNGLTVPIDPELPATPTIPAARARALALAAARRAPRDEPPASVAAAATAFPQPASASSGLGTPPSGATASSLRATPPRLVVYHDGLAAGVPGLTRLAWMVTVRGAAHRHRVFIDAENGKLIAVLAASPSAHRDADLEVEAGDGVEDPGSSARASATALRRDVEASIHPTSVTPAIPTAAPASATLRREVYVGGIEPAQRVWREGDPLPYGGSGDVETDAAVNTLIDAAGDTYHLFRRLSGGSWDSWDGGGATFRAVYRAPELACPNAAWNGESTVFCAGTASDDLTAHEWTHAYGERIHGLLYQWQSGALDEAYADIFGELVDRANGLGSDDPAPARIEEGCSAFGGPGSPTVTVHAPASIAGLYSGGQARFGPSLAVPIEGSVVIARDAADEAGPLPTDACSPLANASELAGNVALVDRGTCTFVTKVRHAQAAGAIGVIVVNHEGNALVTMGGEAADVTIPSIFIARDDGARLREAIPEGLAVTLGLSRLGEQSWRWLMGEDAPALGGAFRDLWNPSCFANAGRVRDARYTCGPGTVGNDYGGVHWNSGIAARAFTMLADGMSFNGEHVRPIGITKAAAIYWRAMRVYQHPTTDFADHADALEASCADLAASGVELPRLDADGGSGERLSEDDCAQVAAAIRAVELRRDPVQCRFVTLLTPNVPPSCRIGLPHPFWQEGFEGGGGGWRVSHQGVFREFDRRDFTLTGDLPDERGGTAFFAPNPARLGNCQPGSDDQSGVLRLESPALTIPRDALDQERGDLVLAFDHWLATEPGRDGGVLELQVGNGPWRSVPASAYLFNPPNATLDPAPGNRNPLAGSAAWSGTDDGSLGGSWGQSRLDLGALADPGDSVRLRFSLGSDGCVGRRGWYVDELAGWTCKATGACVPGPQALCLLGGRYRLDLTWHNPYSGASGVGKALPYADFTGFFAFEDPANPELVVKLLNFGDVVKVYYGQLTDLDFALTVTETATGRRRTYGGTDGNCGGVDETGFPKRLPGLGAGWAANGTTGTTADGVTMPQAACAPTADTLCLQGGRFSVRVDWQSPYDGSAGTGGATTLSDFSGLFTFTDPRNVELVVKVLDFGDRVLFLWGALSTFEYTIEVADTLSGAVRRYHNPGGQLCGGIDPAAF